MDIRRENRETEANHKKPGKVMANNLTNQALLERRAKAVPRGVGTAVPIFVDRAANAEIWDVEGNRFIDFASGIAVTNTGHRHPKVIAAARAQLARPYSVRDRTLLSRRLQSWFCQ